MELEQTVVELNGKKIDVSKIGNERVAQVLSGIYPAICTHSDYKDSEYIYKDGYNDGYHPYVAHHDNSWYPDHKDYTHKEYPDHRK